MASKAQRAVTGVSHDRWAQFGKALQDWREDVLDYEARSRFADERDINIRLVQDLEKNYRQSYTKWKLRDAARAYEVTYESMLAFLHGKADELARAEPAVPVTPPEPGPGVKAEWQPPIADPARRDAGWPYAEPIFERLADLADEGVTSPSGDRLFPDSPADAKVWDGTAGRMETRNRVWVVADVQRRAAGRDGGRSGKASGDLGRGNVAGWTLVPAWCNGSVTIVPAAWRRDRGAAYYGDAYNRVRAVCPPRDEEPWGRLPAAPRRPGEREGSMAMAAVPARTDAAGNIGRIPVPRRAPGWEDVRRAMITAAEACAAAVAEMCRAPGDGRAADRAGIAVEVLRELGAQAGCLAFDDAVIEAERDAAVQEFREALLAAPCPYRRLRAVP